MEGNRSRETFLRGDSSREIFESNFSERKPKFEIFDNKYFIKEISKLYDFSTIKNLEHNLTKDNLIIKSQLDINYIKKISSIPTYTFIGKKPIPSAIPTLPDFWPAYTHTPQNADFAYTYLTNQKERLALLGEVVRIVGTMDARSVNTVVFCDRGARPLATLVAQLWPTFSKKPMPAFFFINTDPKRTYGFDAQVVPAGEIEDLRNWILSEYQDAENPFRDSSAVVCVVDENKATGKSAAFVQGVVTRALGDRTSGVYCDWAYTGGADTAWRNRAEVIGAQTQSGKFKSKPLETKQAEMLQNDLIRLAQSYQAAASLSR